MDCVDPSEAGGLSYDTDSLTTPTTDKHELALPREILLMIVREAVLSVCKPLESLKTELGIDEIKEAEKVRKSTLSNLAMTDRSFNAEVVSTVDRRFQERCEESRQKREGLRTYQQAHTRIGRKYKTLSHQFQIATHDGWSSECLLRRTERDVAVMERDLLLEDRKVLIKDLRALREENEKLRAEVEKMRVHHM